MIYMQKKFVNSLILLLLCSFFINAEQTSIRQNKDEIVQSAKNVIQRIIGERVNEFSLEFIDDKVDGDYYELSCSDGLVNIRGTSTIAITRGFYDYLRINGLGMITWSGERIDLPKILPDYPNTKVKTPFEFREYFNVCTFGYTTVWWDWNRWEKELDWMALHGINMPLAMVGQEIIWTRLWESFGVTRNELNDFFTGAAFLPWQRMGNVNKHCGPLSDEWMENQKLLQHKILDRMRELGMTPIAPAFSGFVPQAFERIYPNEKLMKNSNWGNFPDGFQTYVLNPGSELFLKIGTAFIEEYEKEFGKFDYYLADTFNELKVPVSVENRYNELADFGKAVFSSINSANKNATWVMQGWMFGNDKDFWDQESVKALLRDVPDDKVMILDLANEMFEGWKIHNSFLGKKWISSVIHNFGGNNPLYGDINFFAHNWADVISSPDKGKLVGIGLSPEGIENNEVIYELLTDAVWSTEAINLNDWIQSYTKSRYGKSSENIIKAWQLLIEHVYTHNSLNFKHAFQFRPSSSPTSNVRDTVGLRQIVDLFLSSYDDCKKSKLFINDFIEVTAHYTSIVIDKKLKEVFDANIVNEFLLRDSLINETLIMMKLLDKTLSKRDDLQLGKWIDDARSLSKIESEKDLLEKNARTQVTIWGGPDLYDYASKLWSGLVKDFYLERWQFYFDELKKGKSNNEILPALVKWEEEWTEKKDVITQNEINDPLETINMLISFIDNTIHFAAKPEIYADQIVITEGDSTKISIQCNDSSAKIYYSLDGKDPDETYPIYQNPFYVKGSATIKAKSFKPGFHSSLTSSIDVALINNTNGIVAKYYESPTRSLSEVNLNSVIPTKQNVVYSFDLNSIIERTDNFIVLYETELEIIVAGEYTFYTESDDGSRLYIDNKLIVDNDGYHAKREAAGKIKLEKGKYFLQIQFFEATGAEFLSVKYEGPGFKKIPIESSRLFLTNAKK